MKYYLQEVFYALQIKVLLIFSPATLFRKISQLDWYGDTLQTWINGYLSGANLRVLDVGCATGYLTEYIFDNGGDVSGLDISKSMIGKAKQRKPAIDFRVGEASKLPFKEEEFDVIASASVINITSNPGGVVEQTYRVCKPGGWATFLFPVDGFTNEDLYQCSTKLGISGFSKAALSTWHKTAPKISVEEVKALLNSAGFNQCESKIYLNGMVASVSAKKSVLL